MRYILTVAILALSTGFAHADSKGCTKAIADATAEIEAINSDFTAKTQELTTISANGSDADKIEAFANGTEWVQGIPDRLARIRATADRNVKSACPAAIHRMFLKVFDKGQATMLEALKPILGGE